MHEETHDLDLPATPSEFRSALLHFINVRLPQTRQGQTRAEVGGTTPLFESGPIDSLGILHLIAFVEKATGHRIPTRMVTMQHFRTVDAICEAFGPRQEERGRT